MLRPTRLCVLVCLALSLPCSRLHAAERERLPLNQPWQLRQLPGDGMAEAQALHPPQGEDGWMTAVVPGDVHLDLLRNGRIPDPFYRMNEAALQWVEKAGWEYGTDLEVRSQTLQRAHVELVFDSLDAACTVYLNGEALGHPDNMFRQWRYDVKGKLHAGKNALRIVFPAPMRAAEAEAARDPWHDRTHTDAKGYIRKAVYEFGWDWGPRFATSGVVRPAYLEVWDEARLSDLYVEQASVSEQAAHLAVHAEVAATHAGDAELTVQYGTGANTLKVQRTVPLAEGVNRLAVPVDIAHPQLWFPAGYGPQTMYRFQVSVQQGRDVLDKGEVRTGLRSVELRRNPDPWGRSFAFVINGIPVFAKGADVIPFDSFPNRVKQDNYRQILQSARDANMNIVRLWGGGYYETEEFYALCDELGLMVWHDLMFGNNWQPGTYAFKQNIQAEAEYQMTRLRNHPSIVLWAGNNETELLRDWNGNGQLPAAVHEHIWQDYLTEFSGILAATAAKVTPEVPYWPSSPSADYEELTDAYQSGDNHDWTVWHGKLDFDAYEQHPWRFVSEFGFQSFPEMRTIESFTVPEDRTSILSPIMLAHQKNASGNSLILDYMHRYFGEPKDFEHLVYASQVLQAEAVKTGAEGWRRARPRTMGTIFWQLNDCWPVASWSSIDYYGRWKALQYYARRFYAPVLVSPHVENGELVVYGVSDRTVAREAKLSVKLMHFDGRVIREAKQAVSLPPLSSTVLWRMPLSQLPQENGRPLDLTQVVAVAQLEAPSEAPSSNLTFLLPAKQIELPPTDVERTLVREGDGYALRLSSKTLARDVYTSFGNLNAKTDDNYVDLIPGQPVTIHIFSGASLEQLQASLRITTLADAFLPRATASAAHP